MCGGQGLRRGGRRGREGAAAGGGAGRRAGRREGRSGAGGGGVAKGASVVPGSERRSLRSPHGRASRRRGIAVTGNDCGRLCLREGGAAAELNGAGVPLRPEGGKRLSEKLHLARNVEVPCSGLALEAPGSDALLRPVELFVRASSR